MKTKPKYLILPIAFVALAGMAVWCKHSGVPSYKGRTAESWFEDIGMTDDGRAEEAFEKMGTNAFPFLMRTMLGKENSLQRMRDWAYFKLPQCLRFEAIRPWWANEEYHRRLNAESLIRENSNARQWLPELVKILSHGDQERREQALSLMAILVEPADTNYVAALTAFLKSPDAMERDSAARALARIQSGTRERGKVEIEK